MRKVTATIFKTTVLMLRWIPQTQRKIKARVTHQIFASFSRKKDEENENDDDMFGGFGSRKGKKALRR